MAQVLSIPEEELSHVKKLVEYGIFSTIEEAVKTSVEFLVKQENIKREYLSRGFAKVNGFLMDNIGDMPFASDPIIVYYKNLKVYKFPVKTRIGWNKNILIGFISIDSETYDIIPEISDSAEKLGKVCDRIAVSLGSTLS